MTGFQQQKRCFFIFDTNHNDYFSEIQIK